MRILRWAPVLGLCLLNHLPAASITWNDSQSASSSWSVGNNWQLNTAPTNGDSATFSGSPSASLPLLDDIAGLSLVSITNGANFTQQLNQSLILTGSGANASLNDGILQFGSGSPSLTIAGTGALTSDGTLTGTGGTISVAGALNLTGGSLTGGTLSGAGTVSANGVVAISGISNSTTFSITGGTTTLQGSLSNSGAFSNTGGTLNLADALSLSGGGSVTGNATNQGTSTGVTLSNLSYGSGILSNAGAAIKVGAQNLTLNGTNSAVEVTGGTISTSLAGLVETLGYTILDNTDAGGYNLQAGDGSTNTTVTVQGVSGSTFDVLSGKTIEITNNATLDLSEPLQNDGGAFNVDAGGSVDPATFVQNTGSTKLDGSASFDSITLNGGTLELSGDESGDILSKAGAGVTVDPGGNGTVKTLTESGGFSEAGGANDSLTIDVQGASDYDVWAISSNAAIDGTLNLDFEGGYIPIAGDSYTIVTSGGLSGAFSTVNLVGANGATASVQYVGNDVVVDIITSGATPEPAAWLLAGLGLAALCLTRRIDFRGSC